MSRRRMSHTSVRGLEAQEPEVESLVHHLRPPDEPCARPRQNRKLLEEPSLDLLRSEILSALCRPPYCLVLHGLVPPMTPRDAIQAVSQCLGVIELPYPNPEFSLIRELRPAGSPARPGWGVLTEHLHTDSTNWPEPHDVTLLLCAHADTDGHGRSLLLPFEHVVEAVREAAGPAGLDRLRNVQLPWAIDADLGGGVIYASALRDDAIRWQLYRVAEALARLGRPCEGPLWETIARADEVMNSEGLAYSLRLDSGDLLIVNNKLALHARTSVPTPNSARLMLHSKVSLVPALDHTRLLQEAYGATR